MLINSNGDAAFAYGSEDMKPIDWEQEPYTFWNLVDDWGDGYAYTHPEVVVEAMEQYHFFHNAKTNNKASINKFWSLARDERVNILYDYFNENIDYWRIELEKERDE